MNFYTSTFSLILPIVCLLAFSCSSKKKQTDLAALYLRMGTANLAKGNNAHALRDLLQAKKLNNDSPVIHNNLGLAYFFNDQLDKSIEHLETALNMDSGYTDAKNNMGRVLIEKKDYPEAKKWLNQAISDLTYPHREKSLVNLGLIDFRQKKYFAAERIFLRAMSVKRNYCLAHNYYGRSLFERSEFGRASIALDKATQYCGKLDFDEPHFFSALSHYRKGDRQAALTRLREVKDNYKRGRFQSRATELLERLK